MNARVVSVLVVSGVVALTGCGASGTSASTSPSPSVSETPSQSPSVATATTGQYASIVAKSQADLRKSITTINECAVGAGATEFVCGIAPMTFGIQLDILLIDLQGASDESKPKLFIGAPPAEISSLVADTITSASAAKEQAEAAAKACEGSAAACLAGNQAAAIPASRFMSQLDAWAPYL